MKNFQQFSLIFKSIVKVSNQIRKSNAKKFESYGKC